MDKRLTWYDIATEVLPNIYGTFCDRQILGHTVIIEISRNGECKPENLLESILHESTTTITICINQTDSIAYKISDGEVKKIYVVDKGSETIGRTTDRYDINDFISVQFDNDGLAYAIMSWMYARAIEKKLIMKQQ